MMMSASSSRTSISASLVVRTTAMMSNLSLEGCEARSSYRLQRGGRAVEARGLDVPLILLTRANEVIE